MLNRDTPESALLEDQEGEELDISFEASATEEIKVALRALKNGKASGADRITAEMLKADTEKTSQELKRILDLIWKDGKVLKHWTK